MALNDLDLQVPWGRALTVFGPQRLRQDDAHQGPCNPVETRFGDGQDRGPRHKARWDAYEATGRRLDP